MDGVVMDLPIGVEQIRKATETLLKYKQGKANLEQKITNNEQWFRQRHWRFMESESTKNDPKPASGWLFNTIMSKHADFMDAYPQSDILPRERGDEAEAMKLRSIIPVIMEQNDYESEYSDEIWYKLKNGTGVYEVVWDSSKLNGLGDIAIKSADLLNLFWEPGVTDIQKSQNFFSVELVDNKIIESTFPETKGKLQKTNDTILKKYVYDESIDTTNKSLVIDWYYKKKVGGKTILHFCKYVDEIILYSSENDGHRPTKTVEIPMLDDEGNQIIKDGVPQSVPAQVEAGPSKAERGWYDHGKYPYVFDVLFKEEGMPIGFGFVDICKDAQESIDLMNNAIEKNTLFNATPRYFIRGDGGINEEELMDPNKMVIHTDINLGTDSLRVMDQTGLNGNYVNIVDSKINEMKETSGNRDTTNGSTQAGVTAASAIAAMQEQAGKTSRDMIKTTYRAHKEVVDLVIELIRQFYDMPRTFRILGEDGMIEYMSYSNEGLQPQHQGFDFGEDMGYRLPVFDIDVKAERQSAYSQLSQNELAIQFYNSGFFNPQNADQVLACIDMMEFPGKESVRKKIADNGGMYQQILMLQQQLLQASAIVDADHGTNLAQNVMAQITGEAPPQNVQANIEPNPGSKENKLVQDSRQRAAESTMPQ